VFPDGAEGLVSTLDDYLAFGQMLLNEGKHGRERILSKASVEAMTTDQLAPGQNVGFAAFQGRRGWGFGVAVATEGDEASIPRGYGGDGGYGTSWAADPKEGLVGILMTQRLKDSPSPPGFTRDFWTSAYQAIDD
jgi:CubicO group peptidase (beta-lactamase class C family)